MSANRDSKRASDPSGMFTIAEMSAARSVSSPRSGESEKTAMIDSGNKYAELVYDAFIYQIGKEIGAMAAVLHFDVDAILLGGGIVHDKRVVDGLTQMCGKIAPIRAYPGEFEMEALAAGALRALRGEEPIKTYTGVNVFQGFDHLKP